MVLSEKCFWGLSFFLLHTNNSYLPLPHLNLRKDVERSTQERKRRRNKTVLPYCFDWNVDLISRVNLTVAKIKYVHNCSSAVNCCWLNKCLNLTRYTASLFYIDVYCLHHIDQDIRLARKKIALCLCLHLCVTQESSNTEYRVRLFVGQLTKPIVTSRYVYSILTDCIHVRKEHTDLQSIVITTTKANNEELSNQSLWGTNAQWEKKNPMCR